MALFTAWLDLFFQVTCEAQSDPMGLLQATVRLRPSTELVATDLFRLFTKQNRKCMSGWTDDSKSHGHQDFS